MRGFLVFLGAVFLLGAVGLWLALPPVANVLVVNADKAGGLSCTTHTADVSASPPFELLLGRAESVRVQCSGARIANLDAETLDATFGDVQIFDRRFGSVDGKLTTVIVPAPGDSTLTATVVTFKGDPSSATTEIGIPVADAVKLAETRILETLGVSVKVTPLAPDQVTLGSYGRGTLVVVSGALLLRPTTAGMPSIELLSAEDVDPFHLTGATIDGDSLRLSGTVDVLTLLGLPGAGPSASPAGSPLPGLSRGNGAVA